MHDFATVSLDVVLSIVIVATLALVCQLTLLMLAARKPYFSKPKKEAIPYGVRGGRFTTTGGRGASVHWGAPVFPDDEDGEGSGEPRPADRAAATPEAGAREAGGVPRPRLDRGTVPRTRTGTEAPADEDARR